MLSQDLGLIDRGYVGWGVSQGTKLCIDDIVVRSLNSSDEAKAVASLGVASETVDVHLRPDFEARVLGSLSPGTKIYLSESNLDGAWIHVRNDTNSLQGWVPVTSVEPE